MRLSAPSLMTVLISVLLALTAVLASLGIVQVPFLGLLPFLTLLIGYVLLLLGILIRGL
jgi:hypothetical protein